MNEGKISKLLESLGLTEYEAKTLTALFKLHEAEAPAVSRAAQVPKTRVYDVLDRLVNRKLIIEISGRPKVYRVVEPENVFGELIGARKAELSELEKEAQEASAAILSEKGFDKGSGEKVLRVKDKQDFMRIASQEIAGAQKRISGFTSIAEEHGPVKDALKEASGRDVEIKLIGKIAGADAHAKELAEENVEMKNFDHGLHAYVIDDKHIVLALSNIEQQKPEYHFTIMRDNKHMASALGSYFEQCWGKGKIVK